MKSLVGQAVDRMSLISRADRSGFSTCSWVQALPVQTTRRNLISLSNYDRSCKMLTVKTEKSLRCCFFISVIAVLQCSSLKVKLFFLHYDTILLHSVRNDKTLRSNVM